MSEWKAARVGDICKAANGRAFKPTEWDTEGAPIIRIQNLKNESAPFNYFRGEIEPRFRVQHGDLLFAWSGTPGTSFGAHIWRGGDAVLNQHIFNLHFDRSRINERFFCYALNRNVADYVAKAQGGVGLAHITKGKFEDSFVPLPDIDEQRAVVAELEKQFSRLDEAVAGLQRVKANLKRYKAAVLKAAVEGRLVPTEVELARSEARSYETGAQLLQRILETRRNQWQGKGKYKEPAAPDTAALPGLPEGWAWATHVQTGEVTTGFTPPTVDAENFGGDIPFFKPTDLNAADNVVSARECLSREGIAKGRKLPIGSILVTCIGATIGKTGYARVECATNQQINAISPTPDGALPSYVYFWTISPFAQRQIIDNASATTLPILNKSKFEALALALPPLAEQHRIVAEIDRLFSIAREAQAEVEANLKRAKALRSGILQSAFSP